MQTNSPDLWRDKLPVKTADQHKYDHGHAVIYGAPQLSGATNLAAAACARIGAGLVSVIATEDTHDLYRTILPPHILVRAATAIRRDDPRITALLYGPGGLNVQPDYTHPHARIILDADALYTLPATLSPACILTPHQGEFDKAFPTLKGPREHRIQAAAEKMNCYIVLKGSETLIAGPDGHMAVNTHASPWLATAGSGDVLAGLITGLSAQNMPPFEACCAAVWIHGDCALRAGNHMVASDLQAYIPAALKALI